MITITQIANLFSQICCPSWRSSRVLIFTIRSGRIGWETSSISRIYFINIPQRTPILVVIHKVSIILQMQSVILGSSTSSLAFPYSSIFAVDNKISISLDACSVGILPVCSSLPPSFMRVKGILVNAEVSICLKYNFVAAIR